MADIEDIVKVNVSEVISWSRRTDIPAFFMEEAVKSLVDGYVDVKGPYGTTSRLSLKPQHVKCIAWWSKDYGKWLLARKANKKLFAKYKHVFNFTINGCDELEPGVESSLDDRLKQLKRLSKRYTSDAIQYRFDPIVVWKDMNDNNTIKNNLGNFEKIISFVSACGVKEIHFAFCFGYPKVVSRMTKRGKILVNLTDDDKHKILDDLLEITNKYNMELHACCTSGVVGYKGKIKPSHCIDGDKIEKLLGIPLQKKKKDSGQRKECGCVLSKDAGSYEKECSHSCDYCYANPKKI